MMENVKKNTPTFQQYMTIALIVLLACFALFSIDKDTHAISDLFKLGNLIALIIYFTPTFVISFFMFRHFSNKYDKLKSITLSLVTSIPLSFFLVICLMLALRP